MDCEKNGPYRLEITQDPDGKDFYMEEFEDWHHCIVGHHWVMGAGARDRCLIGRPFNEIWEESPPTLQHTNGRKLTPTHWEDCLNLEEWEALTGHESGQTPEEHLAERKNTSHMAKFYRWDGHHLCEIDDVDEFQRTYNFVVIMVPRMTEMEAIVAAGSGVLLPDCHIDVVAEEVAALYRGEVWSWCVKDEDDNLVDSCCGYVGDAGYDQAHKEGKQVLDGAYP